MAGLTAILTKTALAGDDEFTKRPPVLQYLVLR